MRDMPSPDLSLRLLAWYDRHARQMPWRTSPADRARGIRPDPYRVWLSEVMLQQTTVATVGAYFQRFTARWPTVAALAAAHDAEVMAEWAGLGYYARARNLLACARAVVARHQGRFPETSAALQTLPGIGPYTAAAIAAIAFDEPATVVDGNVERVMARLHALQTPLPAAKAALHALARALTPTQRPGDHAQAVMDLGATICTPRSPACGLCPWADACQGRALGIAAELPRRLAKPAKPVRRGTLWLARRADGAWLVETRPASGLLGGMTGFPGTDWDGASHPEPLAADWQPLGEVRHTFTHFHLILQIMGAKLANPVRARRGTFRAPHEVQPDSLPTLMRKAFALGSDALG
jgi:A/G-specific adenine glycosylase